MLPRRRVSDGFPQASSQPLGQPPPRAAGGDTPTLPPPRAARRQTRRGSAAILLPRPLTPLPSYQLRGGAPQPPPGERPHGAHSRTRRGPGGSAPGHKRGRRRPGAPGPQSPPPAPSSRCTRRKHPKTGWASPATGACSSVTGPQPPPASASAALAVATNLPGRGRRRPCPLVGGRLRRGSTARRLRRHPFVFELTPACRDSASPPDRAAGPFNSRCSAYPAAPARPAPPAPIGCAPPTGGEASVAHWLPPAAQPRRPLPALKLP